MKGKGTLTIVGFQESRKQGEGGGGGGGGGRKERVRDSEREERGRMKKRDGLIFVRKSVIRS